MDMRHYTCTGYILDMDIYWTYTGYETLYMGDSWETEVKTLVDK